MGNIQRIDALAVDEEYAFDYFSGSQISIYIKDIWVSDIESIQFSVSQSKRPVYGYGSQYFHKLASGQVLVEGSMVINFKDAYYLTSTLHETAKVGPEPLSRNGMGFMQKQQSERIRLSRDGLNWQERKAQEYLQEVMTKASENGAEAQSSVDNLKLAMLGMSDEQFADMSDKLKNVLFGTTLEDAPDLMTGNFESWGSQEEDIQKYRRADQYPPFDICIVYGDFAASDGHTTSKKIVEASIMGQGQTIVSNGEPVKEIFQFVGKNLI